MTMPDPQEVARIADQRDRALIALYLVDPVTAARLCDKEIDSSGSLLGRIREAIRDHLRKQP